MTAAHYEPGNPLVCHLCHHECTLSDGATGVCGVRRANNGELALPYYGQLSAVHIDPIEKKPLYHFAPGTMVYSIGFLGCNMRCPFCQNYSISQGTRAVTEFHEPEPVVREAGNSPAIGIAYTYNEPTIHYEYVLECARLARQAGLANVLVTNGNLLESPAAELLAVMDAVNVDLKSYSQRTYRTMGGSLPVTRRFIELANDLSHVEVTTLLVTGMSDSMDELDQIASFVASVSPRIPLHISAYRPSYRHSAPATSVSLVNEATLRAARVLDHVYAGNVLDRSVTSCTSCNAPLVIRDGYRVDTSGLRREACAQCGAAAPIVFFSG